ncbi:tyrosine-protein phosphatase [Pseudonocardia sp. H11422]|uniref:tyrosine-protein phosphatase n=1 Tax=Pseudonocardia sp. H11422 TaxID=2835866 RepID=UPI001BDD01DF|nr:tyrosine-protein phosphatase [Pseudonocardia sp. H11422]
MSPVEGLLHFRGVGGLPTAGGRRVRRGLLFRSDTPQFLSPAGARHLIDELGIRTVLDLRLPHELEREGRGPIGTLPHRHRHLPFQVGELVGDSSVGVMDPDDPMVSTYLNYVDASPEAVTGVVAERAAADGPTLVHCSVGRDRTGVAVAVVLEALGVPREEVVAEYAADPAGARAGMERLRTMATYGEAVAAFPPAAYETDPESMRRFLAVLDDRYGGVTGMLAAHGVGPDVVGRLRDRLLERT